MGMANPLHFCDNSIMSTARSSRGMGQLSSSSFLLLLLFGFDNDNDDDDDDMGGSTRQSNVTTHSGE